MLKRTLAILSIVPLLIACESEQLIPEKDMVDILTSVLLTDATVISPHYRREFHNADSIDYYSHIYEPMGYTQRQFDSTINHYSRNPAELNRIMDKVVASLSQIESELSMKIRAKQEKEQAQEQKKRDLKKAEE